MAQIWQQPPDAVVTRSSSQRESNIDVSIRPTKLAGDPALLYEEVELAMMALLEHIEEEGIYYEMEFKFYETLPGGTIWKMEGTSLSGLSLTVSECPMKCNLRITRDGNADSKLVLQGCFVK